MWYRHLPLSGVGGGEVGYIRGVGEMVPEELSDHGVNVVGN